MRVQDVVADEQALRIPMSRAEYDALPESEQKFEWVDGEAIELIAPIPTHAEAVSQLCAAVINACSQLRVLSGAALDMPNSVRVPDILVVADYPSSATRIMDAAIVAIEVLSPSTWREDLNRKPKEYGEFGVQQYWTVDLVQGLIVVRENVNGQWLVTHEVTEQNPTADVPIDGYCTVHLDLNQIRRT